MAPKASTSTAPADKEIQDPRFASLHTDPRFIRPKKQHSKVVLDSRFASAFQREAEGKGKGKAVDRYGRAVGPSAAQDELRRFYRLEDEDDQDKGGDFIDFARGQVLLESSDEGDSEAGEEEEEEVSSSDEDDPNIILGPQRGSRKARQLSIDLDEDAVPVAPPSPSGSASETEATRRIAVVNMDWDNISPLDLYKVFSSLVSPVAPPLGPKPALVDENGDWIKISSKEQHRIACGRLEAVRIYKSEFGKERMEQEDIHGPPREIFKGSKTTADESGGVHEESDDDELIKEDEGQEYDHEALRKYQLDRLRYFYAILEFDTSDAARHCVEELQGTEFERTANVFDLSYVPDDMRFDQADLHDECTTDSATYQPVDYVTDALRHSKVKLTWDAEDPHRHKVTRQNLAKMSREEVEKLNFDLYLAPGSSDSESSEPGGGPDVKHTQSNGHREGKKARRERMRKLMGLDGGGLDADEEEEDGMEITFAPAIPLDAKKGPELETSLDTYKRKEKERRERKKAAKSRATLEPAEEKEADGGTVDQGFDDGFFNDEVDLDAALAAREQEGTAPDVDAGAAPKGHKKMRDMSREERRAEAERKARLASALGGDGDGSDAEAGHFNFADIVKAEKQAQAKAKGKKLKGAKAKRLGGLKDSFELDAGDERFKSVVEDAAFAIDPSNPQFKKTRNMDKLLESAQAKRKQRMERAEARANGASDGKGVGAKGTGETNGNLGALVASIKRRAELNERSGAGKKRRL